MGSRGRVGAEGPALAWCLGRPSQQAPTLHSLSAPVSAGRETAGRPACCHPPDHMQVALHTQYLGEVCANPPS